MPKSKSPVRGSIPASVAKPVPARSTLSTVLTNVAEVKPELNYVAGMVVNGVANPRSLFDECVSAASVFAAPQTVQMVSNIAWSYSDGVCALMVGIMQLRDNDNYRFKTTVAKGIVNIVNGLQMLLLTNNYNLFHYGMGILMSSSALSPPVFVFACFCEVINKTVDLCHAVKELSIQHWLDERLTELEFFNKKLKKLQAQLGGLEKDSSAYCKQQARIEKLFAEKERVMMDLESRCRYYCNTEPAEAVVIRDKLTQHFPREVVRTFIKSWSSLSAEQRQQDIDKNTVIERQLKERFKQARLDLMVHTISLVGMTLAAVAAFSFPPVAVAATIICTVVAAYFFLHNTHKVVKKVKETREKRRSFFDEQKKATHGYELTLRRHVP